MVLTDFLVLGVVLVFGLWALMRGFVGTVLWISGWVAAAFVTIYGLPVVEPIARGFIDSDIIAKAAAGATLFIVTLVLVSVVSGAISQQVRGSTLGTVDRSLGFLVGLGIGGTVVSLAYITLTWAITDPARHPAWVQNARTLPAIRDGANLIRALVPGDIRAAGAVEADRVRDQARRGMEIERLVRDVAPATATPAAPAAPAPVAPTPVAPAPGLSTPPAPAGTTAPAAAPPAPAGTTTPLAGERQQMQDLIRRTLQP